MKHSKFMGSVVRDCRKAAEGLQSDLARHLGIGQPSLCRKEIGQEAFSFDQICEAAEWLGMKPSELVALYERAVA